MRDCIFCGNKPEKKTKEHIIPKWLIEITGDPNRITLLGKYKDSLRKFPWKNFTFPACDNCNSEYSKLESRTKVVLLKIFEKGTINEFEINDLFDWLDKVRIGLWLGHILLNKWDDFEPNFHIKQRIAVSDRMFSLQYIDDKNLGIGYTGTEFPTFNTSPSCFTLIINHVAIFNASKEFLFARRLGLPYPNKTMFYPGDKRLLVDEMLPGIERIMQPLIRKSLFSKSIKFYQPISKTLGDPLNEDLKTAYFKNIFTEERGKIFIENDESNKSYFLENDITIGPVTEYERQYLFAKMAIQTLEFQNFTIESMCPSVELLDKDEQKNRIKFYRDIVKYNKPYIERLKKNGM